MPPPHTLTHHEPMSQTNRSQSLPDHGLISIHHHLQPSTVLISGYSWRKTVSRDPIRPSAENVISVDSEVERLADFVWTLNKLHFSKSDSLCHAKQLRFYLQRGRLEFVKFLSAVAMRKPKLRGIDAEVHLRRVVRENSCALLEYYAFVLPDDELHMARNRALHLGLNRAICTCQLGAEDVVDGQARNPRSEYFQTYWLPRTARTENRAPIPTPFVD
jgi:hypothetical protein